MDLLTTVPAEAFTNATASPEKQPASAAGAFSGLMTWMHVIL